MTAGIQGKTVILFGLICVIPGSSARGEPCSVGFCVLKCLLIVSSKISGLSATSLENGGQVLLANHIDGQCRTNDERNVEKMWFLLLPQEQRLMTAQACV